MSSRSGQVETTLNQARILQEETMSEKWPLGGRFVLKQETAIGLSGRTEHKS